MGGIQQGNNSFEESSDTKGYSRNTAFLSSIYESSKLVIDDKEIKAESVGKLNNKTPTIINNNSQIEDKNPRILYNKETNLTTTSDKKYKDLNDTSFIDKMISETNDSVLITQLEKAKRNYIFY